jgi:hypothetical protein
MISPCTITYTAADGTSESLHYESDITHSKTKEIMRNFLAQKHGSDLSLFDLDVFSTFFSKSLEHGEIKQLTYELKTKPNAIYSLTIDPSTHDDDELEFSDKDLVGPGEITKATTQVSENQAPIPQPKDTTRKVCRTVLSTSILNPLKHAVSNTQIFSSKEAKSTNDSMLWAFFNSKNLSKITLQDIEYDGADIIEYSIDKEALDLCTIS